MRQSRLKQKLPQINDAKFRALIEKSHDVIVLVDAKARVLYASPSIVRLFGRKQTEFLGIIGLKFVHPLDYPKLIHLLSSLLLNNGDSITTEMRIQHKEGHWLWIEAIATNLLHDSNINAIVINFHDVTERRELEEKKSEFISVASHELRTPITTLKSYLEIVNRSSGLDDERLKLYLKKMNNQISRLTFLINDLLDISKIQQGKLELKLEKFKLKELIKEVVEDVSRTTEAGTIMITGIGEGLVVADKIRISQVIINLISNAIKYSQHSKKITVRLRETASTIQVSVKDTGIGIAKNYLSRIFDRFYQVKNFQGTSNGGLGLGLYISQMIIDLHGGRIWAKSAKGKGSTFSFVIPKESRRKVTTQLYSRDPF